MLGDVLVQAGSRRKVGILDDGCHVDDLAFGHEFLCFLDAGDDELGGIGIGTVGRVTQL